MREPEGRSGRERNRTHQSLIAFLDGVQKGEEGFATLDIQQTYKRINSVNGSHKDYDNDSLLLLRILPVKEMLLQEPHREIHCQHHAQSRSHHCDLRPTHRAQIHRSPRWWWWFKLCLSWLTLVSASLYLWLIDLFLSPVAILWCSAVCPPSHSYKENLIVEADCITWDHRTRFFILFVLRCSCWPGGKV